MGSFGERRRRRRSAQSSFCSNLARKSERERELLEATAGASKIAKDFARILFCLLFLDCPKYTCTCNKFCCPQAGPPATKRSRHRTCLIFPFFIIAVAVLFNTAKAADEQQRRQKGCCCNNISSSGLASESSSFSRQWFLPLCDCRSVSRRSNQNAIRCCCLSFLRIFDLFTSLKRPLGAIPANRHIHTACVCVQWPLQ